MLFVAFWVYLSIFITISVLVLGFTFGIYEEIVKRVAPKKVAPAPAPRDFRAEYRAETEWWIREGGDAFLAKLRRIDEEKAAKAETLRRHPEAC